MLNKMKGMGTGTIMKLTLALMTAGLFISVGTIGSIGSALADGFDNLGDSTDYTIDLGEENGAQKLSDAAKFVRHRAGNNGCAEDNGQSWNTVYQQTEEGDGYEALADTYIERYPSCEGASSGLSRGIQAQFQELGQDQEGIYSRVAFRATSEITLNSGGGTWLEQRLWGAAKGSLEENSLPECNEDALQTMLEAGAIGFAAGSLSPDPITSTTGFIIGASAAGVTTRNHVGTKDNFVIFVEPDDMGSRISGNSNDDVKWVNQYQQLNGRIYCYSLQDQFSGGYLDGPNKHMIKQSYQSTYNNFEMQLCPGDEGYIQMNKGTPQNDAEAGEDIIGGAYNYPHIVITEKGSCEE